MADYVRQAVSRYKGKVPLWHVVHRAASGEMLGFPRRTRCGSPPGPCRWPTRPTPPPR